MEGNRYSTGRFSSLLIPSLFLKKPSKVILFFTPGLCRSVFRIKQLKSNRNRQSEDKKGPGYWEYLQDRNSNEQSIHISSKIIQHSIDGLSFSRNTKRAQKGTQNVIHRQAIVIKQSYEIISNLKNNLWKGREMDIQEHWMAFSLYRKKYNHPEWTCRYKGIRRWVWPFLWHHRKKKVILQTREFYHEKRGKRMYNCILNGFFILFLIERVRELVVDVFHSFVVQYILFQAPMESKESRKRRYDSMGVMDWLEWQRRAMQLII